MPSLSQSFKLRFTVFLLACLPGAIHAADDPASQVSSHAGSGSVALVHLHLPSLPIDHTMRLIGQLIPEEAAEVAESAKAYASGRQAFVEAGVHDVYAVLSIETAPNDPGYLIIPKTEATDLKKVKALVAGSQHPLSETTVTDLGEVLFVGSATMLQRYQASPKVTRTDLAAPLAAVADAPVQLVIVPANDHRRVVEELMPVLPVQLGGGPSSHLTRGLTWCAIGAGADDGLRVRVVIQASDNAAAKALLEIWQAGMGTLAELEVVKAVLPKFHQAIPQLTPTVDDDRLRLELRESNNGIQTLIAALKPPVAQARMQARRAQSVNNLRQIALAMHNFYDTHKRFPAIGTFDATGQPLLSWRVHLLPYLEQGELYKRFHLDEPWDSPHNKVLLGEMPPVFACPQSEHRRDMGLATYRLVVGEGTAFPGREGIEIRSIRDGTSNTIMAVEVDDKHAVEWTKPEGLPLNDENPLVGIGGQFPGGFNVASCDGAVHWVPQTIDAAKFRLLLLRFDGKPVTWE